MLSYLADWEDVFGPLRLFRYITLRCVLAGATALVLAWLSGPLIIARMQALKAAQPIRVARKKGETAPAHGGKAGTPTMGGLIIFFSLTASTLLWAQPNMLVLVALFVYAGLTVIGFADDYLKVSKKNAKGLASKWKLVGQAVLTLIVLGLLLGNADTHLQFRELWAPFFKEPIIREMPIWLLAIFFFLMLGGSSNAINLTDGVDGLAIGCTVTVAIVYGIMAYIASHAVIASYLFIPQVDGAGELAIVCAALVGASLGFLWFNAHPAAIFMGDTGSLALGGLIGTIAFLVLQPLTLIIVGGIFVIEALSVIIQVGVFKLTNGHRVFRMAPIHHHFEEKGWAETQIVIRFWILSLIFALSGLATLKLR